MSTTAIAKLSELLGKRVGVSIAGGQRIDDCQLIALPVRNAQKFWLWTGREDVFVRQADVLDVWEASSRW
jgi:hypothetical protein